MSKLTELIGSLSNENVDEVKKLLASEANASEKSSSQLYTRAKKAEGFEKIDGKWVKKEIKKKPEVIDKKTNEPSEFDYGEKAFLNANGIKGVDELKKVKDFQIATGKSLDEVIENKYFLADLKDFRDDNIAKGAMPDGSRGTSGGSAKDGVDYWIKKGEMPPKDKPDLRKQYVNEKYKREKNVSHFAK